MDGPSSCDFVGGEERNEAELREIAALQQEIAEQEALLDEHSSKLVKDWTREKKGASERRREGGVRAREWGASHHDKGDVRELTRFQKCVSRVPMSQRSKQW